MKPAALLVINELHSGGAERTLIEVARALRDDFEIEVVALRDGGPAEETLRGAGIGTTLLHGASVLTQLRAWWRLGRLMRRRRPQVILSFLYLADFTSGVLAKLCARRARVYWNVRSNLLARDRVGAATAFACRANARLSARLPRAIVYCSALSRRQHEAIGFDVRRGVVVPNSVAAVPFGFSAEKRAAARATPADDVFTFLFVGRFDPVKRVDIFLAACAAVTRAFDGRVRVLIAGRGMDGGNAALAAPVAGAGLGAALSLLGHQEDPQALYSAADCLVVTSESEGSPNVVYEAIATGLPAILYATEGTEDIAAPLVTRLPRREIDALVAAMLAAAQRGPAARELASRTATGPLTHPLVEYYRGELQGRDRS